jgi:hypothetical protein
MAKNYPQPGQAEKIPFWRRRWFWEVMVAVVYVFAIQKFVRIQSGTSFTLSGAIAVVKLFFLNFHTGTIVFFFFLLPPSLYSFIEPYNKIIYYFSLGFYYLFLIFALYKMFVNTKVKIKYPIILIILIVLNLLGIMLATYYSQHPT